MRCDLGKKNPNKPTSSDFKIRKNRSVRCIIMGFTFETADTRHQKGQNLGKSEHWSDSMPQILLYGMPSPCFQHLLLITGSIRPSSILRQYRELVISKSKQGLWGIKTLSALCIAGKMSVQARRKNLVPNKVTVTKSTWTWTFLPFL